MPNIQLPREATGQELTDVLKVVAEDIRFKYYDSARYPYIWRPFPEDVPENLKSVPDAIPTLQFRFSRPEPEKMYTALEVQTRIGTSSMQPTKFEGKDAKYRQYYDSFVEGIAKYLRPEEAKRTP